MSTESILRRIELRSRIEPATFKHVSIEIYDKYFLNDAVIFLSVRDFIDEINHATTS